MDGELITIESRHDMKFDVIIGNPPYQRMHNRRSSNAANPIYNIFIEQIKKLNPKFIVMIIPTRWYASYASGVGLTRFREDMLNDKRIRKLVDFDTSTGIFKGININGGICYFLWDKDHNGDCEIVNDLGDKKNTVKRSLNQFPIFVRANQAVSIIDKVLNKASVMLKDYVYSRNIFGIKTNYYGEAKSFNNSIVLISSKGVGHISSDRINKNLKLINKFKVAIIRTASSPHYVISGVYIINPGEVCTDSYLVLKTFDTREEAVNFANYIKLKFTRFLIKQSVSSINLTAKNFIFVPDEDIGVMWTDAKLYEKYNLTEDEINFIESTISDLKETYD